MKRLLLRFWLAMLDVAAVVRARTRSFGWRWPQLVYLWIVGRASAATEWVTP